MSLSLLRKLRKLSLLQRSNATTNMAWRYTVRSGQIRRGGIRLGVARRYEEWFGLPWQVKARSVRAWYMVRRYKVRLGTGRHGQVWRGGTRHGEKRRGVARRGAAVQGEVWRSTQRHGVVWRHTERHGTLRNDVGQRGLAVQGKVETGQARLVKGRQGAARRHTTNKYILK